MFSVLLFGFADDNYIVYVRDCKIKAVQHGIQYLLENSRHDLDPER